MRAVRDDLELLRAWHGGDPDAGRALFDRYFANLRRFFVGKAHDEAAIDDLIQRTLLVAVERSPQLTEAGAFRAYLFTVARHELFALYRKRARTVDAFDSQVHSAGQLVPSPSGLLARRDDERALLAALRRLPIDLQIALELYYWEELSTEETAAVFAIPPSTLTTRLARARKLLHDALAGDALSAGVGDDALEHWIRSMRHHAAARRPTTQK